MTEQTYIEQQLKKLREPSAAIPLEQDKLEDVILAKILSKKFRKYHADQAAIDTCRNAIRFAVANNQPIKVGLLFGGNKIWRLTEAPEVDWAELFSLLYYSRWLQSIANVYKHGVSFEFYSQDVSIERLNNIPRGETDQYSRSFRALLMWFKPYAPDGVSLTYKRHAELYRDLRQYDRDLDEAIKLVLNESRGALPKMTDSEKRITDFNVRPKPGQTDDPLWREKVELEHQAIFRNRTLVPYLQDETIVRVSAMPYTGYLALGSTKHSVAKFWASAGVLRRSGDTFYEQAVTPSQLAASDYEWADINLAIPGKNFNRIRILN